MGPRPLPPTDEGPAPPPPLKPAPPPDPGVPASAPSPSPPRLYPLFPPLGPTPSPCLVSPGRCPPLSDAGLSWRPHPQPRVSVLSRHPLSPVPNLALPRPRPLFAVPALCPLLGAVPFPLWTPASLHGHGALGGDQEGARSPGCVTGPGAGPAFEPVCGSVRRAPGAVINPVEAPLRLPGPARLSAPLRCWGRSASPRLGSLHQVCSEMLCSVSGWGSDGGPQKSARVGRARRPLRLSPRAGWRARGGRGSWGRRSPQAWIWLRFRADSSRLRSSRRGPAAAANAHPF